MNAGAVGGSSDSSTAPEFEWIRQGDIQMNFIERTPDGSRGDSGYSKLALLALCALIVIAAINRQLAPEAPADAAAASLGDPHFGPDQRVQWARRLCQRVVNGKVPSHQADCVRCVDDAAAAAARPRKESLLVPDSNARA
jgi:hypothetical protein